jgi:adenosylcobinamide kinase/adenosylcobinamide-phosphate guanylyltransferase
VLVLGGARSGKSLFAERVASSFLRPVVYVATLVPSDAEMRERVARHRATRPAAWQTVEASQAVAEHLSGLHIESMTVLLDSVTLLVGSYLASEKSRPRLHAGCRTGHLEDAVTSELRAICTYAQQNHASLVFVSDEVGLGVVPPTRSGRLFRDILGVANQWLAMHCEEVYLVVAGLPLAWKKPSAAKNKLDADIIAK